MPRKPIETGDLKIEQQDDIKSDAGLRDRSGDIIEVDPDLLKKEYADELAFNEEPVTVILQPSTEKNASPVEPVWVNGIGAEVLENDRWRSRTYLPVGVRLTLKRKYVERLLSAKFTRIETITQVRNQGTQEEYSDNTVKRVTSATRALTICEDQNPKGGAWVEEMMRRNF
jgi:hypothetical protein